MCEQLSEERKLEDVACQIIEDEFDKIEGKTLHIRKVLELSRSMYDVDQPLLGAIDEADGEFPVPGDEDEPGVRTCLRNVQLQDIFQDYIRDNKRQEKVVDLTDSQVADPSPRFSRDADIQEKWDKRDKKYRELNCLHVDGKYVPRTSENFVLMDKWIARRKAAKKAEREVQARNHRFNKVFEPQLRNSSNRAFNVFH